MKLLCLASVLAVAVLVTPPVNAMHGIQKRAAPGPGSWAIVDETAVVNALAPLANEDQLIAYVENILNAADALPRNIPNLFSAILAAVDAAVNSSDYYYYSSLSAELDYLLKSIGILLNAALNNSSPSIVSNLIKNVVVAAQVVSCSGLCGTFSSNNYATRLQTDMTSGSTVAIVTDCFALPQAAIIGYAIHSPTVIAMPTVKLLNDISALLTVCINQNTAGLAAAVEAVLADANAIGKLL